MNFIFLLIICTIFSVTSKTREIDDQPKDNTSKVFIYKQTSLPKDFDFILPLESTKSQYVRFFWHIHKTGGSYVRKVANLGYKLKPRAMLGSEKEIDLMHRRMCGISITPQERLDANKSCHDHARNLLKSSKIGIKHSTTSVETINK